MTLPDGVDCILAPNPSLMTGAGTNTYVLAGPGGCLVIDPGPLIESHLDMVAARAQALGGAQAIVITHGHLDHTEGAVRLRSMLRAPVLAQSREGVPDADALLQDGAQLSVGSRLLIALHTPGHRFDHLCFLLPDAGAVFAGDLVAGSGTVVIAPPEGDLAAYLTSLERLRALAPRLLLPGHGPIIVDPIALLDSYTLHRLGRERQIVAQLEHGSASVAEIVAALYTETPSALLPMASLTVTAQLLKLEHEGRVGRTGPAAHPQWGLL